MGVIICREHVAIGSVAIGSNGCGPKAHGANRDARSSNPDGGSKTSSSVVLEFNQQLKRNEPKPGSSIKRYERAIILIYGKSRQEEGHEHVVDVKKMETEK